MILKFLISLTTLSLPFISYCQLPTIKAIGGEGKNVNWQALKKEADSTPDGPGFFYNDCSQGTMPVKASSTLNPQGKNTYGIKNLSDSDPTTAWVEGKPDYGIGEYFEIKATDVNIIYNGYQSSALNWLNNSRVKKFKVYKNNTPLCFLELTDEMGAQRFELPGKNNSNSVPATFRFEIVEVYKGQKWSDVAISHIDLVLCCFAETTLIEADDHTTAIAKLSANETISIIDLSSGIITSAKILKTTKQTHLSVLDITAGSKKITVTPSHPLYIKGIGLRSLSFVLQEKGLEEYHELIDQIEILTIDEKTKEPSYEKLSHIEYRHGVFETYSILKLSEGENFIANGFVTKIY